MIVIVFIIILLTGVILFSFRNYLFVNVPERTVMNFLTSIENQKFNDSLQYVWPPERDKVMTSSKILESVSNIQDSKVQIKFNKLKYKIIKKNNKDAEVNVVEKLEYHFFDASKEETFNRNFKLIKDKKNWYIKSIN